VQMYLPPHRVFMAFLDQGLVQLLRRCGVVLWEEGVEVVYYVGLELGGHDERGSDLEWK
jgi:hypothetical protein